MEERKKEDWLVVFEDYIASLLDSDVEVTETKLLDIACGFVTGWGGGRRSLSPLVPFKDRLEMSLDYTDLLYNHLNNPEAREKFLAQVAAKKVQPIRAPKAPEKEPS